MSDVKLSLVDLGKLSEPVTKLIEAVQGAIGVLYEPTGIRRRAEAEADAAITLAKSRLEITALEQRAARRIGNVERRRQANIEAITEKAAAALPPAVSPDPLHEDWVYRFFGECQDISDEELQLIWGRILAGEVASPGSFRLRTLSIVRTMTREDADAFCKLAALAWTFDGSIAIVARRLSGETFDHVGLKFDDVLQLEALGLIRMETTGSFAVRPEKHTFEASYCDSRYVIEIPEDMERFTTGVIVQTKAAEELIRVCTIVPSEGYKDDSLVYCI